MELSSPLFPIVGIGTSAGGLEALELFLSQVPTNCGLSFIIVQHLSPTHIGNFAELLQRCTPMIVRQVTENTKVEPDHVYVIPPNKDMTIRNRVLHLSEPQATQGPRLPIDTFLNSLAHDCAKHSIGVILSGMGSDGTLGLCSIKEHGGLSLVQDPASAKFDSMPNSAINSGCIDIIAPAEELPGRILSYLGGLTPCLGTELNKHSLAQTSYETITFLLKAKTRHDFSLYKPTTVYRRIERRMAVHNLSSIAEYARFLQKNSYEVDLLFKELLIGVTSFFRDSAMWEELKNDVLPKILAAYPEGGTLRAWSCGCSTGEEAYSLAILFKEALDNVEEPGRFTLQIFATDLDADAIDRARKGLYPATIESDISPERLQRFFHNANGEYSVCKEIREMVTFACQNVIMDPPFTKLDILICRNLLIYLTTHLQKSLLPLFHYSLNPGGLLFLGSAETIGIYDDLFTVTDLKSKLFWRTNGNIKNGLVSFPSSITSHFPAPLQQEPLMLKTADNLQQLADNLILQYFSTPTVLVNDQGDIIYVSGRTGKYLETATGKANLNIFAMAKEGLKYTLGSAFSLALHQDDMVSVRAESGGPDNSVRNVVDLSLIKIAAPDSLKGMVLISFKDVTLPPKAKRRGAGTNSDSKQVEELEQELFRTREELRTSREEMQTTYEELKSTNEELQSTNEELQSTNEELTTSKEEMQSMNEELQSVNAEQTTRLDDFMQVNNDMENLLNSTEIVTIFLDNDLHVRRFTTGANKLFKLIPSDVGRPLTDVVSNLDYPQLYEHVQDVLRKLISLENQVSSLDGHKYLVRVMPYRTLDKKINGVVITFNDITAAKKIEDELRRELAKDKKK